MTIRQNIEETIKKVEEIIKKFEKLKEYEKNIKETEEKRRFWITTNVIIYRLEDIKENLERILDCVYDIELSFEKIEINFKDVSENLEVLNEIIKKNNLNK
jgi:methyl-accepting chemotaxis protein